MVLSMIYTSHIHHETKSQNNHQTFSFKYDYISYRRNFSVPAERFYTYPTIYKVIKWNYRIDQQCLTPLYCTVFNGLIICYCKSTLPAPVTQCFLITLLSLKAMMHNRTKDKIRKSWGKKLLGIASQTEQQSLFRTHDVYKHSAGRLFCF